MRPSRLLLMVGFGLAIVTVILFFTGGRYEVTAAIGIIVNLIGMSLSRDKEVEE